MQCLVVFRNKGGVPLQSLCGALNNGFWVGFVDGLLAGPQHPVTRTPHRKHEACVAEDDRIDLDFALRKLHELALADGDLGYAYWYQVRQLLMRAAGMQAEMDALRKELEQCRARRRRQG